MNKAKIVSLLMFFVSISAVVMAQPPATGSGGGGSTPIDGGLSLLVGGIAAYGAKKIRDSRKK